MEFKNMLAGALMQLAVIGGIGMLVEIFFKRIEDSRAQIIRDDTLRLEMLRRLRRVNAAVVRARRLIRWHETAKTYGEQLRSLMVVQSELLEIKIDIKTFEKLFRDQHDAIVKNIEQIADYILIGIEEYGQNYKKRIEGLAGNEYRSVVQNLEWISGFVDKKDAYNSEYEVPLVSAKDKIRKQIYRKRSKFSTHKVEETRS